MSKAFRPAYSHNNRPDLYTRPELAPWLLGEGEKTVSQRYWIKLHWATPPWLNDIQLAEMKRIYLGAPEGYHVDHIVPLKSPLVCGLHVPWNLQVIPEGENLLKSNKYWPECPHENLDLFGHETGQLELL